MSAPAASVIIPLYNKRSTISRAIDAILSQTAGDFELIVVDDGSADGSAEYVEQTYADPRLRIVRQPNGGPGAARNRGFSESRGALVTFLDADDWRDPDHLATAIEILRANPDCLAFTSSFTLGPDHIDRWAALGDDAFPEGPWRLTADTPRRELPHCTDAFHSVTAVYRREAFEAAGGFFAEERCTLGEDAYLWIRLLLNGPIYRHTRTLGHYHTEDSELGIAARPRALPIEPVLTHPEGLRTGCPAELRGTLELWLAYQAVRAGFMQLDRGERGRAEWLLRQFPAARAWRGPYVRLRVRLFAPWLWRGVQAARAVIRRQG